MIKIKQIKTWASGGLKCRFMNTYEIYFQAAEDAIKELKELVYYNQQNPVT